MRIVRELISPVRRIPTASVPTRRTEPGQYRGVAEISIDGESGMYSSKNFLTVEP